MDVAGRVIVVDDQEDIGVVIERLLRACKDLRFAAWLPSPVGLAERIAGERGWGQVVVMLDSNIPGYDCLKARREVSAGFPDVRAELQR
jgi:hypothetical protein